MSQTHSSYPDVDMLLGGRYRLLSRIAGGGMGDVWCASDESLGRVVAVKILRREYTDDPTFLQRFRAEARHTAALSHSGIATVYDYSDGSGDEVGQPFLVMEFVPGEPLSQLLDRDGALGTDRTLDFVSQAAFALQAAHDVGVVHRDVKPGNLLITPEYQVKVSDFGISRAQGSVPLTQTGAIMGTAYYLSPEQASGRPVTPASDLYSLGVVAYECLSGRRPFLGDTPVGVALAQVRDEVPALPDDIDPQVRRLVLRLLAKDPADRPACAGEVGSEAVALRDVIGLDAPAGGADRTMTLPAVAAAPAGPGTGLRPQPSYGDADTDTDTDPGFTLPARPSTRRSWLPYAVPLLALAVLMAVVAYAWATTGDAPGGAGTPPTRAPIGTVTDVTPSPPATTAPSTPRADNGHRGPGNGQGNGQGNGDGSNRGPGNARDQQEGGR
jgi:hypothetical protein